MQQQGSIMKSITVATELIARIAYINLMWIGGVLIGGIILGIMPATTAVHDVVRRTPNFEFTTEVFRDYWKFYKKNFKQTNLIGVCLLVVIIFFTYNIRILVFNGDMFAKIILAFTLIFVFIFVLGVITFFPVYSRYEFKTLDYVKNTMIIVGVQPLRSIMTLLLDALIIVISLLFPPLLIVMTAGTLVYVNDAIAKRGILRNAELEKDDEIDILDLGEKN